MEIDIYKTIQDKFILENVWGGSFKREGGMLIDGSG
jgi:hypothetical protein